MSQKSAYLHYVSAGSTGNTAPIPVDEVICFRADDACTKVVTGSGELRIHTPLSELQPMLDPRMFRQAQRSTVVNLSRVESMTWTDHDHLVIKFKELDKTITVCQPYCTQFQEQ
ncbi:MAG: LytTR family transcriptional regulator [Nitrospirota bacterium]|nr:LytTR family transcriptional regulator [Nitrospirota bacterium]